MQWCSTAWATYTGSRGSTSTRWGFISARCRLLLWDLARTVLRRLRCIARWAMRVFVVGRLPSPRIIMRRVLKFTRRLRAVRVLRCRLFITIWGTFISSSWSLLKRLISIRSVCKLRRSSKVRLVWMWPMSITTLGRFIESLKTSLRPKSSTSWVSRSRQRPKAKSATTLLPATLIWASFTQPKVYQRTEPKMTTKLQWDTSKRPSKSRGKCSKTNKIYRLLILFQALVVCIGQ